MIVEKDRTYTSNKCLTIDIKIKAEHIEYFMRNTLFSCVAVTSV